MAIDDPLLMTIELFHEDWEAERTESSADSPKQSAELSADTPEEGSEPFEPRQEGKNMRDNERIKKRIDTLAVLTRYPS